MALWQTLRPFGILYGTLAYLVVIWYIFPNIGMLYQEKSGKPSRDAFFILECLEGIFFAPSKCPAGLISDRQ
jgi:hypothetical protein